MSLNNTVSTKINDQTLLVLTKFGNEKDWELSKTIRNVINSYIEEHNLVQMFTSD
jgi:hypothetical protein